MIITFTANPCIDVTLDVPQFAINEVNRAVSRHKDPAGKGINVSRALAKNGGATAAVFPSDNVNGAWIVEALDTEGIETIGISIHDEVRTNITVVDDAGNTTKVNEAGPIISADERRALLGAIESTLETKPMWLVAAGSLPRGLDSSFYVEIGKLAAEHGVRFAVDTSGGALAEVAHAGIADLMKPNHEELEELAARALPTVEDVADFARGLLHDNDAAVLVSLGENGALLVTHDSTMWAGHEPVVADSTVGAGDSSLAGFLHADVECRRTEIGGAEGHTLRLATAVAWGAAAVQLPATTVPGPENITIDRVHTSTRPDPKNRIEDLHV